MINEGFETIIPAFLGLIYNERVLTISSQTEAQGLL